MKYLVAIQHPRGYDGSLEGEDMIREIDDLNDEMEAEGARICAYGLQSIEQAKSIRAQPDGAILVTDLESKEHVGGFWLLECASMDEAFAWDRKATVACRVPVGVRQIL